jgi:hypothetical protein
MSKNTKTARTSKSTRTATTKYDIEQAAIEMAKLVAQYPGMNVADYRELEDLPTRTQGATGKLTAGKALRAAARRGLVQRVEANLNGRTTYVWVPAVQK